MEVKVLYHGEVFVLTRHWGDGAWCLQVTHPSQLRLPHVEFAGGYPNEYYVFLANLSPEELAGITYLDGRAVNIGALKTA